MLLGLLIYVVFVVLSVVGVILFLRDIKKGRVKRTL